MMKFFTLSLSPGRCLSATVLFLASVKAVVCFGGSASWNGWGVFWEYHTDLTIAFNEISDSWDMRVDRGEYGEQGAIYLAGNSILLVKEEAIRIKPEGVPSSFDFLGEPGDIYYRLPFSEPAKGSNILYLGINSYGIRRNVFSENEVLWELAEFAGPGDFFLYQVRGAQPLIYMDSRSANPPYGPGFQEVAGSHSHFEWIFREKGIYLLSFRASGQLMNGEDSSSDPIPFFFLVDPEPFEWWLVDQFREDVKSERADLMADASGDGYVNLLAYAFGYAVTDPAVQFLPRIEKLERDGQTRLALLFRKPDGTPGRDDRSDLIYRLQASDDLVNWMDVTSEAVWETATPDTDETPRVRAIDPVALGEGVRRFLRLEVERM